MNRDINKYKRDLLKKAHQLRLANSNLLLHNSLTPAFAKQTYPPGKLRSLEKTYNTRRNRINECLSVIASRVLAERHNRDTFLTWEIIDNTKRDRPREYSALFTQYETLINAASFDYYAIFPVVKENEI